MMQQKKKLPTSAHQLWTINQKKKSRHLRKNSLEFIIKGLQDSIFLNLVTTKFDQILTNY